LSGPGTPAPPLAPLNHPGDTSQGHQDAAELDGGQPFPQKPPGPQAGQGRRRGQEQHGEARADPDEGLEEAAVTQHQPDEPGGAQQEPALGPGAPRQRDPEHDVGPQQPADRQEQPDPVDGWGSGPKAGEGEGDGGERPDGRGCDRRQGAQRWIHTGTLFPGRPAQPPRPAAVPHPIERLTPPPSAPPARREPWRIGLLTALPAGRRNRWRIAHQRRTRCPLSAFPVARSVRSRAPGALAGLCFFPLPRRGVFV